METTITILVMGLVCMSCFFMGAKVGQAVAKGATIEAPNPIKAIEEHKARQEAKEIQDRMDVIMGNIERYDGTSVGQREVPRG